MELRDFLRPCPKPPAREKKPPKWLKRTRVITRRKKARPGRLKGDDLRELRERCFDRDNLRCTICGVAVVRVSGTPRSGHMAHIGAKRRHGDTLSNVRTLCAACHALEHRYGKSMTKPVPPKPSVVSATKEK